MRYVDYALAWILLITAIISILYMEVTHPAGAILDTPFFWLVVAMLNFVRLRNAHAAVAGLRTSCIGANFIGSTLEVVRFRLFGVASLNYWGAHALLTHWAPYTFATIAILGELLFSIIRRNDPNSPAR